MQEDRSVHERAPEISARSNPDKTANGQEQQRYWGIPKQGPEWTKGSL